jgi:hypothetical protein
VRVWVHLPDGPAKGMNVCADSFTELLQELDLPADSDYLFSTEAPTDAQPNPPSITEPELWGLAKNTHLYAFAPKPCIKFALQVRINPELTLESRCGICSQPLHTKSHQ